MRVEALLYVLVAVSALLLGACGDGARQSGGIVLLDEGERAVVIRNEKVVEIIYPGLNVVRPFRTQIVVGNQKQRDKLIKVEFETLEGSRCRAEYLAFWSLDDIADAYDYYSSRGRKFEDGYIGESDLLLAGIDEWVEYAFDGLSNAQVFHFIDRGQYRHAVDRNGEIENVSLFPDRDQLNRLQNFLEAKSLDDGFRYLGAVKRSDSLICEPDIAVDVPKSTKKVWTSLDERKLHGEIFLLPESDEKHTWTRQSYEVQVVSANQAACIIKGVRVAYTPNEK